jgi:hypothetical protein
MTTFIQEQEHEDKQAEQLKRNRVTRLASVFARANSVLTGKRITVNVVDKKEQKAPAWSSTTEVWLNLAEIKDDFSARSITSLQGLDFHELAHLRYTPRNGHALPKWVKENNLWEAFNCLEDSRIENLLVGYLPTTASWLTATITDYLLSDTSAIETSFPLITGRKYLPAELQQLATDNYKRPQDIDELFDLVSEYNGFIFEGADNETIERAQQVIKRFSELIDLLPPLPTNPNGEGGV